MKIFKQLGFFNAALFLAEWAALEYFGMKACLLFPDWSGDLMWWGEMIFTAFLFVLVVEAVLILRLDAANPKPFLTPLLLTHLPWLAGIGLTRFAVLAFPPPHDFLLRKIQVLFGLMWMAHLFLFSGWILWRCWRSGRKASIVFAWVGAFFLAGSALWTSRCDLSGDEPHYLLMAYSLIHNRDLNLSNNYLSRDYERFYHRGPLLPQGLDHMANGELYSFHPLGPVLLVLPGFYAAGRMGASLTMALLAAWALFLLLRVLEYAGAKGPPLYATGAVGLLSSPLLFFSGLIFPEVPTAWLVSMALLFFLERRWGWVGVVAGGLLWMHNRNLLLVPPLLLFAAVEILKSREGKGWSALRLTAGFLIPVSALAFYFHSLYGVWTPWGAHHEPFSSLFQLGRFPVGFLGLVLDQECGLWFHFPIFALIVAGGVLLWRSSHPLGRVAVGTFGCFYFCLSFYENLGLTPAARYMVGVTPFLLLMLYPVFERLQKWDFWAALTLLQALTSVLVAWILTAMPWMRYNKLQGENLLLKMAGDILHWPLVKMEPSFQAAVIEPKTYLISLFWMAVAVGFTVWFLKVRKDH